MGDCSFWADDLSDFEAAERLRGYFARFASVQENRRSLAERYATAVEGMRLTSLGPWGYSYDAFEQNTFDDLEIPIIRNVAFAVVDTLTSKIGAIDPPLPAMLTNRGSWKDRRQAADLEELVRAEYKQPKGLWPNLHDLWVAALRLAAACTGVVAVQFFASNGKCDARIHDTLNMAWSQDMRRQVCVTWLPVEDAIEMWPDGEDDIRLSAGEPPDEWRMPTRNGEKLIEYVAVYEGYSGCTSEKPGHRVVCVKNGAALENEEYPHERPPFVWLGCTPHLYGPLAHCMVHHIYESVKRDNLVLARVDRAISKTNESERWVDQSKLVNPDSLTSTDEVKIILTNEPYEPGIVEAPGFSPEHLQVADRHYQDAHDISGMSQSHTAGQRQEGIDSAIGQRYVAALVNERFASLQQRYVQAVAVDSAKIIIQVLCEIFDGDPKLMRLAPGEDTLKEISGKVALRGIEQIKYVVQPAAVSGQKGNPADRMQTALELKQLGILSDSALAAMQGQGYDLPEEVDDADIERQWVDKQIWRWQFASDDDVQEPDFYRPPFEHMKIGQALLQVVQAYLEADMDDLEPERLDFFFRFMADCAALATDPSTGQAASVGAPMDGSPMGGAPAAGPALQPAPQVPAGLQLAG
jgi:hypothetical protein